MNSQVLRRGGFAGEDAGATELSGSDPQGFL